VKFGIGWSQKKEPFKAGIEAAQIALKQVKDPTIAIVFASVKYNQEEIACGIKSILGSVNLIGCSSFVEVSNLGVTENSICLALINGNEAKIFCASQECSGRSIETGEAIGSILKQKLEDSNCSDGTDYSFLNLLYCDMNHGIGNDYIVGLRNSFKCTPMTYFGGGSSWDRSIYAARGYMSQKSVFLEQSAKEKALSSLVIALPKKDGLELAFGFSHGWTPVTSYHTITKAKENLVYEIDGRPVFEFYESILGENFFSRLESLPGRYCFSIEYGSGDNITTDIRNPAFFDEENGTIGFFPPDSMEGTRFRMTYCTRGDLLAGAKAAAQRCLAALGGKKPEFIVMTSCIARYDILNSLYQKELEVIREVMGFNVPIIGCYAGGEIGPLVSTYDQAAHTRCKSDAPLHHGVSLCLMAIGSDSTEDSTKTDIADFIRERTTRTISKKDEELKHLRALLKKTEDFIDDSSQVLTTICLKNRAIGEELAKSKELVETQNHRLLQTNERYENLQDILRRYTPKTIWKKAGHSVQKGLFEIENEEIQLTFLFLDVKGFTAYAEKHSPNEVIAAINRIFEPVTNIIYDRDGDIDKFIGDAILAIFFTTEDAIRASKKILEFMAENTEKLAPFRVRIGLNKGRVVMGNVGAPKRMDHTLIGDAVNLAQRLESSCEPGKVLISESVFEESVLPFRHIEKKEITVKGKEKPVTAYECSL
jgi:class 3 adenylate cyclase